MIIDKIIGKLWKPVAFLGLLKLLSGDPVNAQTIMGQVTNQLDRGVEGVNVTAENKDKNLVFKGTTDQYGIYYLNDVVVPVELTSFTGIYDPKNRLLNLEWVTASETNNYGFDLEQYIDGEWQKLGFLQGKGTTNNTNNYSYSFNLQESGEYSFRLKQIDFDGQYKYVPLNLNIPEPNEQGIQSIFGSSDGKSVNVKYNVNEADRVFLKIFDIKGQETLDKVIDVNKGYFTFNWNGINNSGDKAASGDYILKMKINDKVFTRLFTFFPGNNFIVYSTNPQKKNINFSVPLEEIIKFNKSTNTQGVVYDLIFTGNNVLTDTLKNVLVEGDKVVHHSLTQIIKINFDVEDNYSGNKPVKDKVENAKVKFENDSTYTDSDGNTTLITPINSTGNYLVEISKDNYFTRTATIASILDSISLDEQIVPYPKTVSPDTLYNFIKEGHGDRFNFWDEQNAYWWIAWKYPSTNDRTFSPQEMDYIEARIRAVEDTLSISNKNIVRRDSTETQIPANITYEGVIVKGNEFSISYQVNNNIIESAYITLYEATDEYFDQTTAELVSRICTRYEIQYSISPKKSILHRASKLKAMQEADLMNYWAAFRFKQEKIDDVLKIPGFSKPSSTLGNVKVNYQYKK